jgi:hypothetical protein
MFRKRKLKQEKSEPDDNYEWNDRSRVSDFHPHCFVQPLALAESRQFDEIFALQHTPVLGEDEEEA